MSDCVPVGGEDDCGVVHLSHQLQQPSTKAFLTGECADPDALSLLKAYYLEPLDNLRAKFADEARTFVGSHPSSRSAVPLFARVSLGFAPPPKGAQRPHRLPGRLVVSLTSHPRRFRTLALTLRALLQQTLKADHTILWVTRGDRRLLPKDVLDLQKTGLEIRTAEDMRSYMKVIPALEAFPDAFICTADDDTYYWPTWLQELVDGYERANPTVTCHRAHGITFDAQGRLSPYARWRRHVRPRGEAINLFPTGCMGVLYPPGTLSHNADDRAAALDRCPLADDVWLYWIGQRNGARYKTVGRRRRQVTWYGSQRFSLWSFNANGGNDLQIRRIAEKYGYPPVLAKIAQANGHGSVTSISTVPPIELSTYALLAP
jgi:hypothetical protein